VFGALVYFGNGNVSDLLPLNAPVFG
jgi:hypothetical protein